MGRQGQAKPRASAIAKALEKPVARSTTPARKSVAKSTSCPGKTRRQVHYCRRIAFASHTEVFREAGRGQSRRTGGSRKPIGRLCQGAPLAGLRPRGLALAPTPDGSYLADLCGATCAASRAPKRSPASGAPHVARPTPGSAAERIRRRQIGRIDLLNTPPQKVNPLAGAIEIRAMRMR